MDFMIEQLKSINLESSLSILAILKSIINHIQSDYDKLIEITS